MNYLGESGYMRLAAVILDAVKRLRAGIEAIPGLHVIGEPDASLMAFGSGTLDMMAVCDVMDDKGWHLDRQRNPDGLHMMVTPNHSKIVDQFLADLRYAVAHHGESRGKEARYS